MAKPTQYPVSLSTNLRSNFDEVFEVVSATNPDLPEADRAQLALMVVSQYGLNTDLYRLGFRLSGYLDRFKNTVPYNYFLKHAPRKPATHGSVMEVLDQAVYFEGNGNTSKVVAVDPTTNRVLTETGSVYLLGRNIGDPSLTIPPKPAKSILAPAAWPFPYPCASDYSRNPELAKRYVERREDEARDFTKSLVWGNQDIRFAHCIYADVYGYRVVHDLSDRILDSAGGRWGELFQIVDGQAESIEVFDTLDCFVAYMLAKFW